MGSHGVFLAEYPLYSRVLRLAGTAGTLLLLCISSMWTDDGWSPKWANGDESHTDMPSRLFRNGHIKCRRT